jgi:hypothetical protein
MACQSGPHAAAASLVDAATAATAIAVTAAMRRRIRTSDSDIGEG